FLGGGVIFKEGGSVRGLTTAAGVWCSAAVGTLAGAGFGWHAAVGTALVLVVLIGFVPLDNWLGALHRRLAGRAARYQVRVVCDAEAGAAARAALARHLGAVPGATVTGVRSRKRPRKKQVLLTADVTIRPADDKAVQEAVGHILAEPGVRSASWRELPPAG